ncbi:plasmid mobilization protein [Streptococcus alactolyticus]|uniref:plasmid mobilization protein n=1 Tax=Streptococcus alactolyticus TaxID=29389 RepID=UPI003F980FCB
MKNTKKESHGRQRDVPILFWVTEEEKKMIRRKMLLSKTRNMSAYLRMMSIDGLIINVDTTYQKKQYEEMHKIGVNINQVAKLANTCGTATPEDLAKLQGMLKQIWHILKSSPSKLQ